ncbi:MAG: hypothetical protein MRY21_04810 [Simkaniaceae bacterium]|nr:hypothetical protein [Simkaniaceae bacterium]
MTQPEVSASTPKIEAPKFETINPVSSQLSNITNSTVGYLSQTHKNASDLEEILSENKEIVSQITNKVQQSFVPESNNQDQ